MKGAKEDTMALLERSTKQADDALRTGEDLAELGRKMMSTIEALNLTCATQGRKLAQIEKLLLERAQVPHLRDARFVEPYLAHIRNVLLERP